MAGNRPAIEDTATDSIQATSGNRIGKLLRYGLLLVPLAFLAVFYFYPLSAILETSLIGEDGLDLRGFDDFLTIPRYLDTLWFTMWQAVVSTVLTIGLALPGAYVFARYRFPGKQLLMSIATLPFVLPTVVVAAAFRALIYENGLLNVILMDVFALDHAPIQIERSLTMILLAHVFYNYAIALRMISGYWVNQAREIDEAAQVLGASGWRLWLYVRLPLLRPAITAAALLVFIFTFTSFGVILILGELRLSTLEVAIFRETRDFFDLPMAATLSLIQIGIMLLMMIFYTRLQRQISGGRLDSAKQTARRPRGWRQRLFLGGNLLLMTALLFTPLFALIIRSLTFGNADFSTVYYANLIEEQRFGDPVEAIRNSLQFAIITTLLAVILGLISAYLLGVRRRGRAAQAVRWLDPLFMLPLATSAVTLGLGFLVSMDFTGLQTVINNTVLSPFDWTLTGDWDLRDSMILIPAAHTLVAMPFVVRSVLPALRSIPQSVQEAAIMLGASPWQVWRYIDLPLLSRGILVGATFAFTVSMGEFGASLFIARPDTITVPVLINSLIGRPTTYGEALALSVLLMTVCGISFILIERLRTVGVGEF